MSAPYPPQPPRRRRSAVPGGGTGHSGGPGSGGGPGGEGTPGFLPGGVPGLGAIPERSGSESGDDSPERLYVITGGRSGADSDQNALDLVTLIVARAMPQPRMQPEQAAILRMCQYPLSVAEISAYLGLPASAVTVLLHDLLADGRVEARAPIATASLPDAELLEAVIHGLQKL